MSEFFFVLKVMFFTLVAVLLMQVRWGEKTIETHTMNFLTESSLVAPIDDTAQAAIVMIRNGWNSMIRSFNTRFSHSLRDDNRPGNRLSGFTFGRSESVANAEKEKAREEAIRGYVSEQKDKVVEQGERAIDNSEEAFARLKRRAREAGNRIKSRFIDETKNPVDEEASRRASASPPEDNVVDEAQ